MRLEYVGGEDVLVVVGVAVGLVVAGLNVVGGNI